MPRQRSRVASAGTYTYTVLPADTPGTGCSTSCGHVDLAGGLRATDTTDFTNATATVQIVVGTTGSTGVGGGLVFPSGDCCFFSQPTPYIVTVSGSTAPPTGTVNVVFNGQTLATGTLTPGSGASSTVTLFLISSYFVPGNNNVTINYLGDTNYVPTSNSAVIPLRNPAIGADPATVGGAPVRFKCPTPSLWQEP